MRTVWRAWKLIVLDTLGILLIVISPFAGILPGPGGIPIFLAGLGLLSLNHQWARRLLIRTRRSGSQVSGILIRENRWWQIAVDIIGVALLITAVWLLLAAEELPHKLISISLVCVGIYLLGANRKRFHAIQNRYKAQAK